VSERRSVWLATTDQTEHPPLDGDTGADVVVVGAGITGLTAALLLQRDGARVAVIEARRAGAGTTGNTTGKVTSQHGLAYRDLIDRHGEQRAGQYAQANQQAVESVAALAQETSADCQLERAPAYVYALTSGQQGPVEAEHVAAVRLGLPATLTTETDLPFEVALALRFDDQLHLHPGRYLAALARALTAGGGRLFEHTRALGLDERRDHAVVHTDGGDVRAEHVVVATLLPFADRGGFFARTRPTRAYGIAARLRDEAPAGMHISSAAPTRSTRPWIDGDRRGLVVVGESHPTGQGDESPRHWVDLERWTSNHFAVESFAYRWSSQDYTTVDEIPYVGRSPRTARTLVATGFRKWGLTNGTAAAHMLADLVAGRDNPWIEAFDARRVGGATALKKLVEGNVEVASHFVRDRLGRRAASPLADLQPGEGGVVDVGGRAVGAYRDAGGEVHAVGLTCPHMGCTVRWNAAETSWDCPCHGSRFSHDGAVLDGPAVAPLGRVEVDPDA
jgi:glycine/D-amino acid oxidase-like deaminating enzyme/nitrite reductase/ring-hydroxylating ferredoxin subunit